MSCLVNSTLRAIVRALEWVFSLLVKKLLEYPVF